MSTIVTSPISSVGLSDAYHQFTFESVAQGGADRREVESWFESHVDLLDRGHSWDDLIDRLDGSSWSDGRTVDIDCGYDGLVCRALLRVGRAVRQDMRAA